MEQLHLSLVEKINNDLSIDRKLQDKIFVIEDQDGKTLRGTLQRVVCDMEHMRYRVAILTSPDLVLGTVTIITPQMFERAILPLYQQFCENRTIFDHIRLHFS